MIVLRLRAARRVVLNRWLRALALAEAGARYEDQLGLQVTQLKAVFVKPGAPYEVDDHIHTEVGTRPC